LSQHYITLQVLTQVTYLQQTVRWRYRKYGNHWSLWRIQNWQNSTITYTLW